MTTHPVASTWSLPPERAPLPGDLRRTNLRALAAREGRFEHHLLVVATVGDAQLEIATASEPLFFAHQNVSDEYVVALSTGDPMIDAFPMRVFLSDVDSHEDVGRLRHGVHDLVLHPYGHLHWPGRLRPPYAPPPFPPGARRSVLSLVFCGNHPVPPAPDRPLEITPGREGDAKAYAGSPPLMVTELGARAPGVVARVGDARMSVAAPPFAPARGGYVVVLDGEGDAFPNDLVYVPAGERYDGAGVKLAVLVESDATDATVPPGVWERVPEPPFARYEDGEPGSLPWRHEDSDGEDSDGEDSDGEGSDGPLELTERSADEVTARIGDAEAIVPRYWLARMLFRVALHSFVEDDRRRIEPRPCFGYVETYGGLFYDDRGGFRLGLRGGGHVTIEPADLEAALESLYRAVAPPGYVEDLR